VTATHAATLAATLNWSRATNCPRYNNNCDAINDDVKHVNAVNHERSPTTFHGIHSTIAAAVDVDAAAAVAAAADDKAKPIMTSRARNAVGKSGSNNSSNKRQSKVNDEVEVETK